MTQDPSEEERLAALVDRTLRGLPPRRAPRTLELRVLAALERREPVFWWQRSFKAWPVLARAAFVSVSLALVACTLLGDRWIALPAHQALGLLTILEDLGRWVYPVAAVGAALYASLFGLGVVAYRTLYLRPGKGG